MIRGVDLGRAKAPERSDDERWADAEAMLRRHPLADAGDWRPRTRKVDRWLAGSLVAVAAAVVVWVVGVRADGDPAGGWQVVAVVLALAGFVLQWAGLAVGFRTDSVYARREKPLSVLTRAQRRELRDQVRGRVPVRPERRALVRWQAEQQALGPVQLVQGCGILMWTLALGATDDVVWLRVLRGVAALAVLGAGSVTLLAARRGRRSLAAHPEPAAV